MSHYTRRVRPLYSIREVPAYWIAQATPSGRWMRRAPKNSDDTSENIKPPAFSVMTGEDALFYAALTQGADGGILASAHLRTSEFAALIAAWHAGKAAEARELGGRLAPLSAALFAEPNPVVIKGVLHAQGKIPSPAVRLPLLPARPTAVRAALSLLGASAPSPAL